MKILIVEDEPALRELIQRSLEKERYVTEVASDFDSALDKIEMYDYDCVLLDIMLPGGSGLDVLSRLKEQLPSATQIRGLISMSLLKSTV